MTELSFLVTPMPLHLWRASLAQEPDAAERAWLSADELARAARFVQPRDRRRHLAAHCALRALLSRYTGQPPGLLRFELGAHGKPALRPPADRCSFNMSHSEDVALIAVAGQGQIGVDVEMLRPMPDAQLLAERHYTRREQEELRRAAPGRARDLAFLRGWTRKEACLKALGSGLSLEPNSFEAGLDAQPRVLRIDTGARPVHVHVQSFCHDGGLVGAVARLLGAAVQAAPEPLPQRSAA